MDNKNRAVLLELLHDMEDFAQLKHLRCPKIFLLGGSGCVLGGYIDRSTTDIDILDMNYPANTGRLFRMLGNMDYLDMYTTTIARGFEDRAKKLEEFKYLDILVLSKEDIIVTKIGRYSEKDIEDISILMENSYINLICKLIKSVSEREDIGLIIKDEFLKNVERFKEDFNVQDICS